MNNTPECNAVDAVAKLRYATKIQKEVGKHVVDISVDDNGIYIEVGHQQVEVEDFYWTRSKVRNILSR